MELDDPIVVCVPSNSWYIRVQAATCKVKKHSGWRRESRSFGLVMDLFLLWFLGSIISFRNRYCRASLIVHNSDFWFVSAGVVFLI